MDWNLILFMMKWVTIGLFYAILLLLIVGVYREMSHGARKERSAGRNDYGRLRVIAVGDDRHLQAGSMLNLLPETRLGAARDNDILLSDPYVSRHHACLLWDGTTWWVEDLNSRNGTLVNRQPCSPGIAIPLPNGAVLSLGEMSFELIYPVRR